MEWTGNRVGSNPYQGDANWFNERIGYLTASKMKDVLAVLKNGQPAKARQDLLNRLVAERLTDSVEPNFVSTAMQHGIDTEPYAMEAYCAHTKAIVHQCGFLAHPTIKYFGASPDGLIRDDGLVEFKCPNTATHIRWMMDAVVPEEHKPQMLAQMACTGREWCDFVSFDPRIKKEHMRLLVVRFEPEPEEIERIENEAIGFLKEVDAAFGRLTGQ